MGTRMISQGTDGLSQGNLTEGVLAGILMLCFVPLHLSAMDRQPKLLSWICDWSNSPNQLHYTLPIGLNVAMESSVVPMMYGVCGDLCLPLNPGYSLVHLPLLLMLP